MIVESDEFCPVESVPKSGYHGTRVTLKTLKDFDFEMIRNCSITLKKRFYIIKKHIHKLSNEIDRKIFERKFEQYYTKFCNRFS